MSQPTPDVSTAIEATTATVETAQRLGLTWQLRPATVVIATAGSSSVTVVYDGDTATISAVNLLGTLLLAGARVMGIQVPPSGNFILGYALTGNIADRLTYDTLAAASADLTLTGVDTLIPGVTITVTVVNSARYNVTAFIDFDETVLGAATCIGRLYVDGGNHVSNRQVLYEVVAITDRATVGQQWDGTLTAGTHTFELKASRAFATGTQVAHITHSTMRVQVYE